MSLLFSLLPKDFKTFYNQEGLRIFISGMSGSGKSFLAKTFAEELFSIFRLVVIDPEGEWRALKAIGEVIVAGSKDDVPLDPKMFTKYMQTNMHLVYNLKEVKYSEQRSVMAKIVEAVFEYDKPCMLVIEEAHIIAPQTVDSKDKKESLDWVVQISKRGRKRGMGMILATQRPADINKSVISQSNVRFFGKMLDKSDLDALKPYLATAGIKYSSISQLQNGRFLFYDGQKARKVSSPGIKIPDLGSARGIKFQPLETKKLENVVDRITENYLFGDEEEELEEEEKLRFELENLKKQYKRDVAELSIYRSGDNKVQNILDENRKLKIRETKLELLITEQNKKIQKQSLLLKNARKIAQINVGK